MIVTHSYDKTVIFFFFERFLLTVSAYGESREAKQQTISKDVTSHHFATETTNTNTETKRWQILRKKFGIQLIFAFDNHVREIL